MSYKAVLPFIIVLGLPSPSVWGHGTQPHPQVQLSKVQQAHTGSNEQKNRNYFTDLSVVTHEGKLLRFYSDVLKGKVVAITFFYTNCQGMCPLVNQTLSNVQKALGDRMGRDIFFVTISVDPETDTPEVLAKYRKKFNAGDGWIFLTGKKEDIDKLTYRLGQIYPKEAHSPVILLGNVERAHWQKLRPNMPAQAIAMRLEILADGIARN